MVLFVLIFIRKSPPKKMKREYSLLALFFIAIFFNSCSSSRSSMYGKKHRNNYTGNGPGFSCMSTDNRFYNVVSAAPYVVNDSTIEFYFSVHPGNMIHTKDKEDIKTKKPLKFKFNISSDDEARQFIDSGTYIIEPDLLNKSVIEYKRTNIPCHSVNIVFSYDVSDPNELMDYPKGATHYKNAIPFNFVSACSSPYFRTQSTGNDPVYFTRAYFKKQESIRMEYYKPGAEKLFVRYSALEGRPAPPPFYHGNDKVPVANFQKTFATGNHSIFTFENEGNYLVQADTTKREGLWLNCFSAGYPFASTIADYRDALSYVCTQDEYNTIQESDNRKKAIDDFWSKCGRGEESGALLADNYYRRVKIANENFTTSKEGWKTDRGMIYIIYGIPDEMYTSPMGETWFYHGNYPYPELRFNFTRSLQAWGYDYTLIRDEMLRRPWILALDDWRNGRVPKINPYLH